MSRQVIVTITDSLVVAEQIDSVANDSVLERSAVSWKHGMLWEAFVQALAQISPTSRVRILLSDTLCHINGFTIPKEKAGDRKYIQQLAADLFLEDLATVRWDYSVSHTSGELVYIQVICVTKRCHEELSSVQEKAAVKIDAILPASFVLLDSFAEKDESFILVYSDDVVQTMCVIKDGIILFSTNFERSQADKKLQQVVAYAQKYLEFSLQKVVLSGLSKSAVLEKNKDVTVIEAELSAAVNLAELKYLNGQDKKTLNIPLENKGALDQDDVFDISDVDGYSKNTNLTFWVVLIVVSLVGLFGGFFLIQFLR